MADYYSVLGIKHSAEAGDVAKAYRRAALTFNPECAADANTRPEEVEELERQFKLVSQAYVVLSNAKYRAVYDGFGEDGVRHGGTGDVGIPGGLDIEATDPHAVFRQFFGIDNPFQVLGGSRGLQTQQHHFFSEDAATDKAPAKCATITATVEVTLEQVHREEVVEVQWTATHTTKDNITTKQPKSLDIPVPRLVEDGTTFTLHDKGDTADGRRPGDVEVTVNVLPHDVYRREGKDLVVVANITLLEALTGVTVPVTTIEGVELRVAIDEVVMPGFRKKIVGHGLRGGDARGDLIVECSTTFPKYLTADQKTELKRIFEAEQ